MFLFSISLWTCSLHLYDLELQISMILFSISLWSFSLYLWFSFSYIYDLVLYISMILFSIYLWSGSLYLYDLVLYIYISISLWFRSRYVYDFVLHFSMILFSISLWSCSLDSLITTLKLDRSLVGFKEDSVTQTQLDIIKKETPVSSFVRQTIKGVNTENTLNLYAIQCTVYTVVVDWQTK